MRKFLAMVCSIIMCMSFGACALMPCAHEYDLISSVESTCVTKGFDLYQCSKCRELMKEDKALSAEHVYDTTHACETKTCVIVGCSHKEEATIEHDYNLEYVCNVCDTGKKCTLEMLANDFADAMLAQAKLVTGLPDGNMEVVILDRDATIVNLQNYIISPNLDWDTVQRGIFVKVDGNFGDVAVTYYYNFGLELTAIQETDVAFTFTGSPEIWFLEVVEGNERLLFEYSIL